MATVSLGSESFRWMRSSPPCASSTSRPRGGNPSRPQPILGACRPALAHQAMQLEPSIAAVLPCNVVVRDVDEANTAVEALNPDATMGLADNDALRPVATDARQRIAAALAALPGKGE